METAQLKKAQERGALVVSCGDTFDAMQGKFDPRRSMEDLRPEFKASNYYDLIVADAAKYYYPYRENFLLFGLGNHETAVIDKVGTHLMDLMVAKLNEDGKAQVQAGAYTGWIRLMFRGSGGAKSGSSSLNIRYSHGYGGVAAPVTKGTIQTARQAVYVPDADVVINGHNHEAYLFPISRERLSNKGVQTQDIAWFVRTPGYKKPLQGARHGFDVEKLPSPKPNGGVWMYVSYLNNRISMQLTPEIE